jgi:hypothetical protein
MIVKKAVVSIHKEPYLKIKSSRSTTWSSFQQTTCLLLQIDHLTAVLTSDRNAAIVAIAGID